MIARSRIKAPPSGRLASPNEFMVHPPSCVIPGDYSTETFEYKFQRESMPLSPHVYGGDGSPTTDFGDDIETKIFNPTTTSNLFLTLPELILAIF